MSKLTPEYSIGAKKHFPLQSSMSGYTPEQTIGGGPPAFPSAQSAMKAGTSIITPDKTMKKDYDRLDSQVNT